MQKLLTFIARRFWPEILEAPERDRAIGYGDILGILYAGLLTPLVLVWLVLSTDVSVFAAAWFPFAIFLLVIYAFRRLDFNSYIEVQRGVFGSFTGSLEDMVRWPAALMFGPTALWLFLVWRTVSFVRALRIADQKRLYWSATRDYLMDAGGDTLAGLAALLVYARLGGTHPPAGMTLAALTPAIYATVVRFLVPIAASLPFMAYFERSPVLGFDTESVRAIRKLTWMSASWPLLMAPFTVLAVGLYADKGLGAFLFFMAGVLLASGLAHKMSRAVEASSERTRELRSLESLGRALVDGPPDASRLPELLGEHVGGMFAMCTIDVRLFPGKDILHEPHDTDLPDEVTWEWLQATGETLKSPAGRELPWGTTPRSYGTALVPIVDSETGATIGGISLRKRINPETVADVIPAAQSLAAQIASVIHGTEVYQQALRNTRAEEELAVAADMQASLMPSTAPHVPGWEFKAIIDSAREASGDFVDLVPLSGGRWGILIADVSGKGVAAALYMAMVRTLIRTYAFEHEADPGEVIAAANRRILMDTTTTRSSRPSTACSTRRWERCATATPGTIRRTSSALRTAVRSKSCAERASLSVCSRTRRGTTARSGCSQATGSWRTRTVPRTPRTRYDEPFGEGRLLEVAKNNVELTAIEMRTAIFDEIKGFVGEAEQEDDITLMVVARDGA